MTLIIGMYYDNKKGAVIAVDSRVHNERGENWLEKKIFNMNGIIMANAGYMSISKELVKIIHPKLENIDNSSEINRIIQKEYKELVDHYSKKENSILEGEELVGGIFGVYTNKPELYALNSNAYIEWIDNFAAVGMEKENVRKILKENHKEYISRQKAVELAIYCMHEASENNFYVDNNPQIALIEEDLTGIINEDEDENFDFHNPHISAIKNRMKKLSEDRKTAFDILFYGDKEWKKDLVRVLKNEHKSKK